MTTQRHKQAMNLAIDNMLSTQEQRALDEHLDQAPQDAALWERMKRADRMLRAAPLIHAPSGFADRVLLAIASGRGPRHDPRFGLGIALGMLVVALTAIPFFGLLMIGMIVVVTNEQAFAGFLIQVNSLLGRLTLTSMALTQAAAQALHANPGLLLLALLSLPLTAAWVWMMRVINAAPQTVTYRIPVRVTA